MTAKNRKEAEPVFCQVAALRYAKVLNELGISKEAVLEAGNISKITGIESSTG